MCGIKHINTDSPVGDITSDQLMVPEVGAA